MSWKLCAVVAAGLILAAAFARLTQDPDTGTASWDFSRAAAFTGYLLLWGSVVAGVTLHHRVAPGPTGQSVLLEGHRVFGALALAFVIAHVFALLIDPVVPFSIVDVTVPFTSGYRPLAVGAGTIALWLLVVVLASTALAGAMGRTAWWRIHLLSYPAYVLALVHGITSGTDSGSTLALSLYIATGAVAAGLVVVRLAGRGWVAAGQPASDPPALTRSG